MSSMIRKPGEGFDLTDEELVAMPARLLTKGQRRRRRYLRKLDQAKKTSERRAEREALGEAKVKHCQGYTKKGEPCSNYAVEGAKHCIAHLNDAEKAKLGKKTISERAGEAIRERSRAKARVMERERAIIEIAHAKILARRLSPLGLELVGFDEEDNPVVIDHGAEAGLCLHGESKDGDIVMTEHPDLAGQFTITEKILDRTYGRPRQTTTIEGNPNRPVYTQPVRTIERARELGALLGRVHALEDLHGDPEIEDVEVVEETNNGNGHNGHQGKLLPFKGENVDASSAPSGSN